MLLFIVMFTITLPLLPQQNYPLTSTHPFFFSHSLTANDRAAFHCIMIYRQDDRKSLKTNVLTLEGK